MRAGRGTDCRRVLDIRVVVASTFTEQPNQHKRSAPKRVIGQSNGHLVRGWRRGWRIPRCSSPTSRAVRWSWPSWRTSGCLRLRRRSRGRGVPASILREQQQLEQAEGARREGEGVPRERCTRGSGARRLGFSVVVRRGGGRGRGRGCGIGLAWPSLLDADRLDCLLRDSTTAGVTNNHFDLDRLVDALGIKHR